MERSERRSQVNTLPHSMTRLRDRLDTVAETYTL